MVFSIRNTHYMYAYAILVSNMNKQNHLQSNGKSIDLSTQQGRTKTDPITTKHLPVHKQGEERKEAGLKEEEHQDYEAGLVEGEELAEVGGA